MKGYMKLRYLIPMFVAVLTMVSCSEDFEPTFLDSVQVSQSYVALPANGGSVEVKVKAKGEWQITDIPEWLSVSPSQGAAGESVVTFTAAAASETKSTTVLLNCQKDLQKINVIQVTKKTDLPISTCAEIIAGEDAKTYRAKGVVARIANTDYGNWYLQDETGQVYIYGTLDKSGKDGKNNSIASWGLEVGDIVTVEGPKTTYNGTVELVNVAVLAIEKSLIKVDSLDVEKLGKEGGDFKVFLQNKGKGVSVNIPDDAKEWLHITGIDISGTTNVISMHADANAGGERSTTLAFITTDGKKNYSTETVILQEGSIMDVSIAEFNAAEVGNAQYRIKAIVSSISNVSKGRFYIRDYSGETYVYNMQGFEEKGIRVGDIITIVGKRDQYNETIEMTSAVVEDINFVTEVSIAEFLEKPDDKETYYMVTGTVSDLLSDKGAENDYGNLHITDGDNVLYVYGCYPGLGAVGDARKGFVKAANIEVGDQLTMIGYKSTYNGLIELCGGIYFSHQKAE